MKRLSIFLLAILLLMPGLNSQAVQQLIKSASTEPIPVFVVDSTGAPVTGVAGASFTATVRKPNTGSYVAASGSIAEDGNGIYEYTPTSAETTIAASKNILLVHLVVTATATSFGDSSAQIVAFDPADAVRLGLTALPNAAAGALNGLPTGDASGRVLLQPTQTGVTIPTVTNVGTLTTYTGNTPQTGDAYARIGAAGAGLTALGDTRLGFLTGDAFARIGLNGAGLTALGDTRLAFLTGDAFSRIGANGAGLTALGDTRLAFLTGDAFARIGTNGAGLSALLQASAAPTNFSSLAINSSGQVSLNLTQALDPTNTGDTVGGGIIAARAQGFGKWVISGGHLILYAADGTTVLKNFTVTPTPTNATRN